LSDDRPQAQLDFSELSFHAEAEAIPWLLEHAETECTLRDGLRPVSPCRVDKPVPCGFTVRQVLDAQHSVPPLRVGHTLEGESVPHIQIDGLRLEILVLFGAAVGQILGGSLCLV
jgi:hypothetical protein